MQLTINGEACTCAEGLTVAALLREREHDATAVPHGVHQGASGINHGGYCLIGIALNEGDVLEIVQFVGGG